MTDTQQRNAARQFAIDWKDKGYEKGESHHRACRVQDGAEADGCPADGDEPPEQRGIFSSKIKCGDCGSWYGSKVWHSNDKYRRMVWQCNHKFDGGEKCCTPHLDEETIKGLFIKAVNILTTEKDEIAANFQAIKGQLFSTGGLETEQSQLQEDIFSMDKMELY